MKSFRKLAVQAGTVVSTVGLRVINALAAEAGGDELNVKEVLQNAGDNPSVKKVGDAVNSILGSFRSGLTQVAILLALISFIAACVRFGILKSSQKRDSVKDAMLWICIGVFLISSAAAIISAALQLGASIRTE